MVQSKEKINVDEGLIRRYDVKINRELKLRAEMEVSRLDGGSGNKVYLYHVVEPAIERFLDEVTAKLPSHCGPEAVANATGGHSAAVKGIPVPVRHRKVVQGIVEFLENRKPPKTPEERQLREVMLQMIYTAARVRPEERDDL